MAVALVGVYLALNVVVISVALAHVAAHPSLVPDWKHALVAQHGNPVAMIGGRASWSSPSWRWACRASRPASR